MTSLSREVIAELWLSVSRRDFFVRLGTNIILYQGKINVIFITTPGGNKVVGDLKRSLVHRSHDGEKGSETPAKILQLPPKYISPCYMQYPAIVNLHEINVCLACPKV